MRELQSGWLIMIAFAMLLPITTAESAEPEAAPDKPDSPWMLLPTFSSDPKLGTSLGAIGAYMHYFDEKSQPSMFGAVAMYTSTDSYVGGLFAKASFGEDSHRLTAFAGGGVIKNDYDDYLGSGMPLKTTDDLQVFAGRYLYRIYDDWFIGLQALDTNYLITGQTALEDQVLDVLGLTGFESSGIGAVVMHDSRDNDNAPTRGWVLNLNNIAYRENLGSASDYDIYRLQYKQFWSHGKGHVFALHQNNHWTDNAPQSAYASVILRGYKQGQYLGEHMSSFEIEERLRILQNWGATLFTGMACLYSTSNNCSDSADRYPSWGAGIHYMVRAKERIVLNLEYADGKADNYGIYLKMGYGF